jgi:hypothetical protein
MQISIGGIIRMFHFLRHVLKWWHREARRSAITLCLFFFSGCSWLGQYRRREVEDKEEGRGAEGQETAADRPPKLPQVLPKDSTRFNPPEVQVGRFRVGAEKLRQTRIEFALPGNV